MKQPHAWRYQIITALLGLVSLAVLFQILRIQTDPEIKLLTGRSDYQLHYYYPPRGEIYDRNGRLAATGATKLEFIDANGRMPTRCLAIDLSGLPRLSQGSCT